MNVLRMLGRLATTAATACGAALPAIAAPTTEYLEFNKAWGLVVADFDNDGHDDLFISGHDPDDRIWYWSPTGYLPSPNGFPDADRHDCDAADVNQDGRIDLYCAIGAEHGTGLKKNELWLRQPGGLFTLAANFGAEDPSGRGRYPKFFDLNHDGYPDLYIENESTVREDGLPNINHVYRNNRDGTFIEVPTTATGPAGYQCVAKGDVDGDGWDDLLVCALGGVGQIYVNNHADDFAPLATPAIGKWRDARLADMNGDGRDDLVVAGFDDQLKIWFNTGKSPWYGKQPDFASQLPAKAMALTIGDFDHDGHPDVYVVLENDDCEPDRLVDTDPDVVFLGRGRGQWVRQTLPQAYTGCGHLADTLDGDKVLLENGGVAYRGPNFVLGWKGK